MCSRASFRGYRQRLGSLFVLLLLALTGAVGLTAAAVAAPADTHQAVVEFAPGVSASEARAIAASHQATLVREIAREGVEDGTHLYCVQSSMKGAEALAALLNRDGDVIVASPNYAFKAETTTPDDPQYGDQWALGKILAPVAWDLTTGSRSVVVAVLDSGTEYTHPDLADNIWTNPGEVAGNGVDDDLNGYTDDVHGIDVVEHDVDPSDGSYHGTYMAGIIGAVGDNGGGVTGVNWQVSIMPVRCLGDDLTGTTAGALEGAWYIIHEKLEHSVNVAVINTSWGQLNIPSDPLMQQAITAAGDAGIVWTASAGNGGIDDDAEPHYPSGYDAATILSVASSDSADALASLSNYGATTVDLAAPGEDILGTSPGADYGFRSGTSPASANVAGAVALAASLYPEETALQRVDRILSGVDVIPSMSGKTVTGGRLDLYRSLTVDTRPTTTVSGVDAAWHKTAVAATFSATDGTGMGVASTESSLDGAAYQSGLSRTVSGDGAHALSYRSIDAARNVEVAKSATVKIDGMSPSLAVDGAGGTWRTAATVQLQATDVTSGVAELQYALDGASMTPAPSAAFAVPVADGMHTLHAAATDIAGNAAASDFTVKVDTVAPDVHATGADSAWHTTAVTVDLAASDATSGVSSIEYREGTGSWTTVSAATAPVTVSATANDGTHTYEYRAADVAGNVADSGHFTVKIDAARPTVSATGADSAWHTSAVTVDLAGADATSGVASVEYRLVGAPSWTTVAGDSASVIVSSDGVRDYEYRAIDVAGNVSTTGTFTVKLDAAKPTVSATGADSAWHTTAVTVDLTAADSTSGVASVEYRLVGAPSWTTVAGTSASVIVSSDGVRDYEYRSTDAAGNVSTTGSFTVKLDAAKPTVSASGADSAWHTSAVTVDLAAADATSGVTTVEYRLVGAPSWTTVVGATTSVVVGTDGTHAYEYRATDAAGNVATTGTFTVKIDAARPTVSATGADGAWHTTAVTVDLAAADSISGVASVEYRLVGAPSWTAVAGASASVTVSSDGVRDYEYRSIDNAGNVSTTGTFTVKLDAARPTVSATGADGAWHTSAVTVDLVAADATSGVASVEYRLVGAPSWTTVAGDSASVTVSSDGVRDYEYRSIDVAGNVSITGTFTVKLDAAKPTVSATGADGAWHTSAVTVDLTGADATSGVASVEYRLVGAASWTTVAATSASVTVSSDGVRDYEYRAIDAAGNISTTGTFTVKLDAAKPTVSATGADSAWHTTAVTVDLAASDATSGVSSIQYREGTGSWATVSAATAAVTVSATANDGTHTYEYRAADVAGNVADSGHFTVKIDAARPTVSASGADSAWHTSAVTVDLSGADATSGVASVEYRLVGAPSWTTVSAATAAVTVTATANDGTHTYEYRATDVAGNVATTGTFAVKIDAAKPTVSATGADGAWHTTAVTVDLAASDATSGVSSIQYREGTGSWTTVSAATAAVTVSATANDGTHTYEYRAADVAGNVADSGHFTVKIDAARPTVSASGADSAWHTSAVTVDLSGADATSGVASVEYRLVGAPSWTTVAGDSASVTVSSDGIRDYEYRAIDAAGNVSTTGTFTVKLDAAKPTVSATGADSAWHTSAVTVDLAAADSTSGVTTVEYRLVGAPSWTTVVGAATSVVVGTDGTHAYEYRATDVAGNVATTGTFTVKLDSVKPTAAATGADSAWHSSDVSVSISAADVTSGVAWIEYREGTAEWTKVSAATASVTVAAVGNDGTHVYEYRATDNAGNISGGGGFTVKIDAAKPTVSASGADGAWHNAAVDVTISGSDAGSGVGSVEYREGAAPWTKVTAASAVVTVSATGNDGTHTYEYRATDAVGNVSSVGEFTIKIDTVKPTVVAAGADTAWHAGAVTVGVAAVDDASGVVSTECREGTGAWVTLNSVNAAVIVSAVNNDGIHKYEHRATDAAGNVSTSGSFTVMIDAAAPATTAAGADGAWHKVPVTLTFSAADAGGSGSVRTEYSLDRGTTWTTLLSATLTISAPGITTVDYRSTDAAGNLETAKSLQVTIDSVAPTTTAYRSTARRNRTSSLRYRIGDVAPTSGRAVVTRIVVKNKRGATVKTFVNAGTVTVNQTRTYKFRCRLPAGTYRVTVFATDLAGNAATSRTAATLRVKS